MSFLPDLVGLGAPWGVLHKVVHVCTTLGALNAPGEAMSTHQSSAAPQTHHENHHANDLASTAMPAGHRPPSVTQRTLSGTEQARAITDKALETLASSLKQGKSEALCAYLRVISRFHKYSFGNALLILWQRPDATQVAGFNRWKELGRHVRKGEHGIMILAPMLLQARTRESHAAERDESAPTETPATPRRVLRFRAVYVFDVSQTEGEPLPKPEEVKGDPGAAIARLRAFITGRGIRLDHEHVPDNALGVSRGGHISIRAGLTPAEEFATLAHECAHELLHHGENAERPALKSVRETEAEAVAFVVCTAAGLTVGASASDYIQLNQGDADLLAASLDRIQKTAALMLTGMSAEADNGGVSARS